MYFLIGEAQALCVPRLLPGSTVLTRQESAVAELQPCQASLFPLWSIGGCTLASGRVVRQAVADDSGCRGGG